MATATYTNEQGEVLPRYVNTDFPPHPSWSDLGLVVLVNQPGYTTTKTIGYSTGLPLTLGGWGTSCPLLGAGCLPARLPQASS